MSSTHFAVWGRSSLTHIPLFPCWANWNLLGASGKRATNPISNYNKFFTELDVEVEEEFDEEDELKLEALANEFEHEENNETT